jgi:hypothetical protein
MPRAAGNKKARLIISSQLLAELRVTDSPSARLPRNVEGIVQWSYIGVERLARTDENSAPYRNR